MRSSSMPPAAAVTAADAVPHRVARARHSFDSDATDDDEDERDSSHRNGTEARPSRHARPNSFLGELVPA